MPDLAHGVRITGKDEQMVSTLVLTILSLPSAFLVGSYQG